MIDNSLFPCVLADAARGHVGIKAFNDALQRPDALRVRGDALLHGLPLVVRSPSVPEGAGGALRVLPRRVAGAGPDFFENAADFGQKVRFQFRTMFTLFFDTWSESRGPL